MNLCDITFVMFNEKQKTTSQLQGYLLMETLPRLLYNQINTFQTIAFKLIS